MATVRSLAILKTDVRGFTARSGRMSASELDAFLREHRGIVGDILRDHGGTIVKELGDSFLCTFESATRAVQSALAVQRRLASIEWPGQAGDRVEVRIAISAGDVLLQGGDVFGEPVNLAARLEAVTPAGEVFLSEAVYQMMNRGEVSSEVAGSFELKGIAEPVRAHRLVVQHQSREIDAAVLFTDIVDFTRFSESAPLIEVERLLQFWEDAHRVAASSSGGVLRYILGDGMMTTFASVEAAIQGWLALHAEVDRFNAGSESAHALRFAAGIDWGQVRIFRSSVFGVACNRAAQLSGYRDVESGGVAVRQEALAQVAPKLLATVTRRDVSSAQLTGRLTRLAPIAVLTRKLGTTGGGKRRSARSRSAVPAR